MDQISNEGHWNKHRYVQAHSTRAASSSAAKSAGIPLSDIMKWAGWSRQSTFERFYHKPIIPPHSDEVLHSGGHI